MNSLFRRLSAIGVLLVGLFPGATSLVHSEEPEARITRSFTFGTLEPGPFNTHRFLLSPEVVADRHNGTLRLAHSILVADEMGATDFRQGEELSETTWAKKVFVLDSAEVSSADHFLYGSAKQIRVNGKLLKGNEPLVSTGWTWVRVPPGHLKKGENEIILSGGGGLLIEPTRQPGRSFKSGDGGRTWSGHSLGGKNNLQGEYLVRLRLGRFAPRGWAMSSVVDLWAGRPGEVPLPGKVAVFRGMAGVKQNQRKGTSLTPWLRTGSTPTPDPKTWTAWVALDKDHTPTGAAATHRWALLKFDLATDQPQVTAYVPEGFEFKFDFAADQQANKEVLMVQPPETAPVIRIGATPFVYQQPSPRLKLLRERYQLDKVIAPGQTEMEQLMLLRHWVRNQWHTAWGSHPAAWMPPWDALMILEAKDQPDCLTMCTHYAAVFTQCCLALGWTARHCILDHHCVSEVWVNQHRKWVMMDPGNSAERADVNLHFERKGVPQSALELHLAQRTGQTGDLTVCFTPAPLMEKIAALCRPAPPAKEKLAPRPDTVPLAELPKYPVCGLVNFRRYAFPGRNTFLDSLYPGELYQGWSNYYYDGYWWIGDEADGPRLSPEYSQHRNPSRPQDIDWSLNWVRAHLARTAQAGEVRIDLETFTPNLGRLEMTEESPEKPAWKPVTASFLWKLKPGKNTLRVRGVNQFERAGSESTVQVDWRKN